MSTHPDIRPPAAPPSEEKHGHMPDPEQQRLDLAGAILRAAQTKGWPRDEAVDMLRAMGLDDVPVVARAFAKHEVPPVPPVAPRTR